MQKRNAFALWCVTSCPAPLILASIIHNDPAIRNARLTEVNDRATWRRMPRQLATFRLSASTVGGRRYG